MFRLLFCLAVVSFATSEADVLYFKTPSSKDALEDVICPDKRSACPKTTTCCVLSTGAYGCCPLPQATCCSDHVHCCPHGNTCDIKKGRCLSAAGIVRSWVEKRPAKQLQGKSQPVICPDGHHQCPYGQTCCKQRGGDYGCCPFSQAMCCNDGLHCCPHDYKCDVSHGTCVKAGAGKVLLGKVQEAPRVKTVAATEKKSSPVSSKPHAEEKDAVKNPNQKAALKASRIKASEYILNLQAPKSGSAIGGKDVPKKTPKTIQPDIKVKQPNPKRHAPAGRKTAVPLNVAGKPLIGKQDQQLIPGKKFKAAASQTLTTSNVVKLLPKPPPLLDVAKKAKTTQKLPSKAKSDINSKAKKSKAEKEEKKIMEHITETIHATVSAIKDTVHRVVTGSNEKVAKVAKKHLQGKKEPPKSKFEPPQTVKPSDAVHSAAKRKPTKAACETKKLVKPTEPASTVKSPIQYQHTQQHIQANVKQKTVSQKKKLLKDIAEQTMDRQNVQKLAPKYMVELKLNQQKLAHQNLAQHKLSQKKSFRSKPAKKTEEASKPEAQRHAKIDQAGCIKQHRAQVMNQAKGKARFEKQKAAKQFAKQQVVKQNTAKQRVAKQQAAKLQAPRLQQQDQQKRLPSERLKLTKSQQPKAFKFDQRKIQALKVQQQKVQVKRLKQSIASQQKQMAQILKQKQLEFRHEKQVKKQTQHMSVGRKLLGIAWRFLGVSPSDEEVFEEYGVEKTPEISQGEDCESREAGDVLISEGNEAEITEVAIEIMPNKDIVCPDKSTCPMDATCCPLESGGYGCCPIPHAICCLDHIHCCPNGQKCNVKAGYCETESGATSELRRKIPAVHRASWSGEIKCDESSSCPDGNTCCKTEGGGWACCPLKHAVCCSDHKHCCPEGSTCDIETGECIQDTNAVPLRAHHPVFPRKDGGDNIICPDQKSLCPDESTCCQMVSGSWGCCPMSNAVCCSDHLHCCPEGTHCNPKASKCVSLMSSIQVSSTIVIPRAKMALNVVLNQQVSIVKCKDGLECPDGSTCCKNSAGKYACCPHPQAVCCENGPYCCPKGMTCSPKAGECVPEDSSSNSAKHVAAFLRRAVKGGHILY